MGSSHPGKCPGEKETGSPHPLSESALPEKLPGDRPTGSPRKQMEPSHPEKFPERSRRARHIGFQSRHFSRRWQAISRRAYLGGRWRQPVPRSSRERRSRARSIRFRSQHFSRRCQEISRRAHLGRRGSQPTPGSCQERSTRAHLGRRGSQPIPGSSQERSSRADHGSRWGKHFPRSSEVIGRRSDPIGRWDEPIAGSFEVIGGSDDRGGFWGAPGCCLRSPVPCRAGCRSWRSLNISGRADPGPTLRSGPGLHAAGPSGAWMVGAWRKRGTSGWRLLIPGCSRKISGRAHPGRSWWLRSPRGSEEIGGRARHIGWRNQHLRSGSQVIHGSDGHDPGPGLVGTRRSRKVSGAAQVFRRLFVGAW